MVDWLIDCEKPEERRIVEGGGGRRTIRFSSFLAKMNTPQLSCFASDQPSIPSHHLFDLNASV